MMIISDWCVVKTKTEVLTELVRIHERLCYALEEEFEYNDAVDEAEELIECMGFEFELPLDDETLRNVDIVTAELMSIISKLSEEIENKDLDIHYNKKYYDEKKWTIDRIWG